MQNEEGDNVDLYIPRKWYALLPNSPSSQTPSLFRLGKP
jgi:hypothetical protein